MKCALCDAVINATNDTDEHLVLHAIGGRRTVRGVICRPCNSRTGKDWDSVLANQLREFTLICGIKRERGEAPPKLITTTAGESLRFHSGGGLSLPKPTYKLHTLDDGQMQVSISARNLTEAREMLEGTKRKFPNSTFDVEQLLASVNLAPTYPVGAIKLSFGIGGFLAGRSLVKSAFCLAISQGVPAAACVDARVFLTQADTPCFGYYYQQDVLRHRPPGIPFHCVAVSSRDCDGQLLGYVELFGFHRVLVCLADRYEGPEIHVAYGVDPVAGADIAIDFELALSRADVAATMNYERIPDGALEAAAHAILPTIYQRMSERTRDREIADAVDYGLKHCGANVGEIITPEQLWKFSGLVSERLTPFLLRQLRTADPRRRLIAGNATAGPADPIATQDVDEGTVHNAPASP